MFYKPRYCCECGEKVERESWKPWTSRQFCENCETENKIHVLLPRAGFLLALLLGLWGVGSHLSPAGGNEKSLKVTTEQKLSAQQQKSPQNSATGEKAQNSAPPVNAPAANDALPQAKNQTPADLRASENLRLQAGNNAGASRQNSISEPVYFCGAQTKKGNPCSRRVKGGGRCWQHAGQPAVLPPEKLLISQ
jgi:hypothetical protein